MCSRSRPFTLLLVTRKQEVGIVKSFFDEIVYGLSDSAKGIHHYFVYRYFCGVSLTPRLGGTAGGAVAAFGFPGQPRLYLSVLLPPSR